LKIAVLTQDLTKSIMNYDLVNHINSSSYNWYIFTQNINPHIVKPKCFVSNSFDLYNFNAATLCLDLKSAEIVARTGRDKKVLYLYNLEWLYDVMFYIPVYELMNKFTVVARSDDHAEIISNFLGGRDIKVAKDFKELEECLITN